MQRLSSFAFLTALASLSIAGACKSDDASGSQSTQQPGTAASPAPGPAEGEGEPGVAGERRGRREGMRDMSPDQRRAERLRKFDTNGDGKLGRDERQAMIRETVDRRMRRMDVDGDDRISRQEVGTGRFGEHLSAEFDRADSNRDGFISRPELEAALLDFRARRRAERQQEGGGAARGPAAGSSAPPAAAPPAEEDYGDSLDEE